MRQTYATTLTLACIASAIAVQSYGQTASTAPYLRKQGTATQLIVDGKPFLALTGELGNNTASSMENMQPVWPRLVAGNLNSCSGGGLVGADGAGGRPLRVSRWWTASSRRRGATI